MGRNSDKGLREKDWDFMFGCVYFFSLFFEFMRFYVYVGWQELEQLECCIL